MYELLFSPIAERYFKKLKQKALKEAFKTALLEISKNPYNGSPKHADLAGFYCYDLRHGKTSYEITYAIRETNGKNVVIVPPQYLSCRLP